MISSRCTQCQEMKYKMTSFGKYTFNSQNMSKQNVKSIIDVLENTGRKVKEFHLNPMIGSKNGFISEILFAKFIEETDGDLKHHEIVLKRGKYNPHKCTLSNKHFLNEKHFYEVIIPEFKKFHEKHKSDVSLDFVPEYYGATIDGNESFLLLKNLKKDGFDLWDGSKPMTLEIIKQIVTEYGKLHGTSIALKAEDANLFQRLTSGIVATYPSILTKLDFKYSHQNMKDVKELYRNDPEIYKKLTSIESNLEDIWAYKLDTTSPNTVIAHLDGWNNNFLFKFGESVDVKILDWQLVHLVPPVFDLTYCIFSVASEKELEHFDEIIRVYYDSLDKTVRKLDGDINKLYPFDVMADELKKAILFDLIQAHVGIKVAVSEPDELCSYDIDEAEEGKKTIMENFLYDLKDTTEYYRRCRNIIDFCIKHNYV